jgi:hypothetical protein
MCALGVLTCLSELTVAHDWARSPVKVADTWEASGYERLEAKANESCGERQLGTTCCARRHTKTPTHIVSEPRNSSTNPQFMIYGFPQRHGTVKEAALGFEPLGSMY